MSHWINDSLTQHITKVWSHLDYLNQTFQLDLQFAPSYPVNICRTSLFWAHCQLHVEYPVYLWCGKMRLWRSSLSALITQALKIDEMQRSTYVISQDTNVRLKTLVKLASWADLGCGPCFLFGAVRPHWYYQNPRPTASGRLRMGLPEFLGNDVKLLPTASPLCSRLHPLGTEDMLSGVKKATHSFQVMCLLWVSLLWSPSWQGSS